MTSSRLFFRGVRALALSFVIASGVVASMPRDAFANCGPNIPWPTCKRHVAPKDAPQVPDAPDSTGAEPGAVGYVLSFLWALIA